MKQMQIIGRKEEQKELSLYMQSEYPEFLAVYGRRRVGKTFLIREFFKNDFSFYTTGLARANIGTQLKSFGQSLVQYGDKELLEPKNWFEAFARLSSLLENKREKQKKVIFLDELPWMNTHRSGFITALEHFWNSWAAARPDILLIVCGSAASWMMDKLINNHGGLHNRITRRMHLKPFTLAETEKYLKSRGILFSQHQIVETYMILGGIPYYLSLLEKGMSLPQNIDKLCFAEDGALCTEYQSLYASLFSKAENHIRIINALGNKRSGMTREELLAASKFTDGGEFSKVLYELEISGFIRSYYAFGKKSRGTVYQLIDFFSLFYLQFMHKKNRDEHFWLNHIDSSIHRAWTGYTFELLALVHIDAIKAALGISGVSTSVCSWRSSKDSKTTGAQIDLLIDRDDKIINICEIKYSQGKFTIDKSYAQNLRNKIDTFIAETKTSKAIHLTMITTYGIVQNEYSSMVQSEITMDELFFN